LILVLIFTVLLDFKTMKFSHITTCERLELPGSCREKSEEFSAFETFTS